MNRPPERMEKQTLIGRMAGHGVAANLAMLVCLVGGAMALWNIKKEVFPDIGMETVTVSVAYNGASPEEIETGILQVVEEAVRSVEGVDEIRSAANEGSGWVTVELLDSANPQTVVQDIESEVDRITTFPEDAEEPVVRLDARKRAVLNVILYGEATDMSLHSLGERVRDQFLQSPEITQIDLEGMPPLEIGIEVSQDNLRRYGLTLDEIAARLRQASVDVPGGGVKTESGEVLVRVKERRDYGHQFAMTPIITPAEGGEVLLGDIAVIDDSFEDADRYTRFDGKPAVILEVFRVGDQTPLAVAGAIDDQLDAVHDFLPPGIDVAIANDRSERYGQRVELLVRNGALGLGLVLLVLGLFLEARLAFWVMMGIPISFLASFIVLPYADVSVNMVSLFAYIVALGIVVDDAIVVGENVYRYHQEGMGFTKAAVRGARDVAMPVTFSILTNIVAFMPIYFIPGTMGNIFRTIPFVVSIVFVISLFESLFILPAHLAHQRDRVPRGLGAWLHARQQRFSHGFRGWVQNRYGPFLAFALRHRYASIIVAAALLGLSLAYALSGRMGLQTFPIAESDTAQAMVVLPYGTPVETTEAAAQRIVAAARQVVADSGRPELAKSIITTIGRGGSHAAQVEVELPAPEIRDTIMGTEEFTHRWRQAVGEIPGVENLRFVSDSGGPGGSGRPVTVELSHRDIDVLATAGAELAEVLGTYPQISDIDDGFQPGKEQVDLTLTPEGKSLGLTADDVSRQVRSAFYGSEVVRQQRGRNEIRIMVRLEEAERSTEQTIGDLMICTSAGTYVPLREVAQFSRQRAYTTIDRRNGRRVVQVSADVTPRSIAGEILTDLRSNVLGDLQQNHPGLMYSFEGHQADIRESMGSLKVSFVIALLAIYVLLAIPFRSYIQPLVVMVSIPFGIIGAIIGHLIMGYSLCIPSLFGIVALAGVVVNDSLVLVDAANRRRREDGITPADAIHAASIGRFRPIILTTLTTFGGLAPMIFETSRQARFLIPMALSLGFGILFATGITLVLVPSLYMAVEDIRNLFLHPEDQQIG